MSFISKYRQSSSHFQIFSLAIAGLCLASFSAEAYASKTDNGSNLSVSPDSPNAQGAEKIQKEAYSYRHQTSPKTGVNKILVQKAFLKKSSGDLIEGSFILKNTANKDFLLKEITSEKCKEVGQFQDNQISVETTEDASGNIFKNLPIPHLNTIAFPFSSFHLACTPKEDSSFEEGTEIPFTFHFQEGSQTYNFTVQNNAKA